MTQHADKLYGPMKKPEQAEGGDNATAAGEPSVTDALKAELAEMKEADKEAKKRFWHLTTSAKVPTSAPHLTSAGLSPRWDVATCLMTTVWLP